MQRYGIKNTNGVLATLSQIAQPVLPKSKLLDRRGTLQAYGCVQVSKCALIPSGRTAGSLREAPSLVHSNHAPPVG